MLILTDGATKANTVISTSLSNPEGYVNTLKIHSWHIVQCYLMENIGTLIIKSMSKINSPNNYENKSTVININNKEVRLTSNHCCCHHDMTSRSSSSSGLMGS